VPVSESIKTIIVEKSGNENLINQERGKMGVLTIKQDGLLKVLKGMTTLEEIERMTEEKIGLVEEAI
jgi:type II secretory ATPase GspE/PulE/Tfp pilus assembly ATPase PilB-like protein